MKILVIINPVFQMLLLMTEDTVIGMSNTVRCHYKQGQFLKNIYKRHPIARLLGRGMGCLLWVQPLIDILPQFLQWSLKYLVILDHVIMALDCTIRINVDQDLCHHMASLVHNELTHADQNHWHPMVSLGHNGLKSEIHNVMMLQFSKQDKYGF